MQHELTCNQVNALMGFYLEDRLNEKLREYVDYHLNICPKCRERYEQMKKILEKSNNIQEDITNAELNEQFMTRQYQEFKNNLSAYIDNELNDEENIKIKKITISNPLARQDLEEIYTFKRLIHNAFEKTRNDFREDYTKSVIENLSKREIKTHKDNFVPLISAFSLTIFLLIVSLIWFSVESGIIKFSFHL